MSRQFSTNRHPRQPGPAAWNAILPPQPAAQLLDEETSADIGIVGGGFAGLSAARRLLQLDPSLKIALFEAGRIADGPAGRNSGFMIDLPHDLASEDYAGAGVEADKEQTSRNRIAIGFAAETVQEYGLPPEAYNKAGKINAAASGRGEASNRSYAAHLANMDETSELLDAQTMGEITGCNYYRSGLFTPGTVLLQPALYIRGLAQGLAAAGVRIFEHSPVHAMQEQPSGWRLDAGKGFVNAGKVILAVNGHAESFGFFRRRLLHVFTYASLTRALSEEETKTLGGRPPWGVTPADHMGATVRHIQGAGGSRILLRQRATYDPSMHVPEQRLEAIGRGHDKSFARRFPQLSHVPMEYRWGGHLCLSRNGVPAFGEVAPNLFAACCQNGLGTTRGTLAGMAAAERALGRPSPLADALDACDPPKRLPPEPIAWLGANAYMRWKEWQAGAEG